MPNAVRKWFLLFICFISPIAISQEAITVLENPDDVAQKAYEILINQQQVAKATHQQLVIIFPTGSTPIPFYQQIKAHWQAGDLDLSNVITFNMDEYVGLDANHPQSYERYMDENLYQHLLNKPQGIQAKNKHFPSGANSLASAKVVARDYQQSLKAYLNDPHYLVIVYGGIGRGPAHIAFNDFTEELDAIPEGERQNYALHSSTRVVPLDKGTRLANMRFFDNDINAVPKHAITIGMGDILKADQVVIMATDASKQQAMTEVFRGAPSYKTPASLLRLHPNLAVTYLVTPNAAPLMS